MTWATRFRVRQYVRESLAARYMRLWYRNRVLKVLLALLIGTLVFSFSLLRRVETNFVPDIGVTVAGALVAAGLVLFSLFFKPMPAWAATGGSGRVRRSPHAAQSSN